MIKKICFFKGIFWWFRNLFNILNEIFLDACSRERLDGNKVDKYDFV